MTDHELLTLLDRLIAGWEHETVEFKQASRDFETSKIGEYFSALANEANLRGADAGWLIFGVNDKTRRVTGTAYRPQPERLQSLKLQVAADTEPSVTFRAIHEVNHQDGRVVMMEIPPAPTGMPISWKGHWYARAGESLTSLGLDKLDSIRRQSWASDWSAEILPDLTLGHFDPGALDVARRAFVRKHPHLFTLEEVMGWPVRVFTDRAGLTLDGRVTRGGLLLAGRPEASGYLSPHMAQLTWSLVGPERAYEHFSTPFLLSTTRLFQRVRNVQLRLIRPGTLLQIEVPKYDQRIVLEAVHNAVAHQDFRRGGRVLVQEFVDRLVVTSEGSFFEGSPAEYAAGEKAPTQYRNPLLAQAMAGLGMIDTLGYGIFDMHNRQMRRFLPMPDYDLADPDRVKVTIHGAVVDEAYTSQLMARTDLPLTDVLALDRVQKHLPVPEAMTRRLRRAGLIRGRKPNLEVVPALAEVDFPAAGQSDEQRLDESVVGLLSSLGRAGRREIEALVSARFPDVPDAERARLTENLLTRLRRNRVIRNAGTKAKPVWELVERPSDSLSARR